MNTFLEYRFAPDQLELKPGKVSGQQALCLVYGDLRLYQTALDRLGVNWSSDIVAVSPNAVIVRLTIDGVMRCATGEEADLASAEARAFKRACSAFGLGRYLYSLDLGWQPYDGKRFGQAAYAALDKALAALNPPTPVEPWQTWESVDEMYAWSLENGHCKALQHAYNALNQIVVSDLGGKLRQSNFRQACELFYHNRIKRSAEKAKALEGEREPVLA